MKENILSIGYSNETISITWRLPCISIKWTKLQCLSLTVVQHDKGMTNHGLQVNQHNRPAYPVNSAQEAMLRREKKIKGLMHLVYTRSKQWGDQVTH